MPQLLPPPPPRLPPPPQRHLRVVRDEQRRCERRAAGRSYICLYSSSQGDGEGLEELIILYKNNVPQDEALWLCSFVAKAVTMNESQSQEVRYCRVQTRGHVWSGQRGWGSRREWFPKWDLAFREAVRRSGVDMCLAA